MKLFKRMRLVDKYKVVKSKEPNELGNYIVIHETKSLHGCNYQRVYKGTFKKCHEEKRRLESLRKTL